MQSLLRWSIENSSTSSSGNGASSTTQKKDLDPAIIDAILGRPDAELMKEDVSVAVDENRQEIDRVNALEHLEMLVEQIDNANDLAKLQLWDPLHRLLTAPHSTSKIKIQTLWVIGTAVQNNPAAQDAYLLLNPIPTLVSFLAPTITSSSVSEKEQSQITAKALYVLSGLLKHNAPVVKLLDDPNVQGWDGLKDALQRLDPEIAVRRKAIFILYILLLPASSSPPTNVQANIHTSPPAEQQPIHPNSHSVHLSSPARVLTGPLTQVALNTHPTLLPVIIQSLIYPLPHGPDGDLGINEDGNDNVEDEQYEETAVWVVFRYVVTWSGEVEPSLRGELKTWLTEKVEKMRGSGEQQDGERLLAEKWNLDIDELRELVKRLG